MNIEPEDYKPDILVINLRPDIAGGALLEIINALYDLTQYMPIEEYNEETGDYEDEWVRDPIIKGFEVEYWDKFTIRLRVDLKRDDDLINQVMRVYSIISDSSDPNRITYGFFHSQATDKFIKLDRSIGTAVCQISDHWIYENYYRPLPEIEKRYGNADFGFMSWAKTAMISDEEAYKCYMARVYHHWAKEGYDSIFNWIKVKSRIENRGRR